MNDFVAMTVELIKALREEGGDPGVILTEALAAADAIENDVGTGSSDADRQALTAAQRFTYNIAADCWPA
mgnify:CR=1 FL=1